MELNSMKILSTKGNITQLQGEQFFVFKLKTKNIMEDLALPFDLDCRLHTMGMCLLIVNIVYNKPNGYKHENRLVPIEFCKLYMDRTFESFDFLEERDSFPTWNMFFSSFLLKDLFASFK